MSRVQEPGRLEARRRRWLGGAMHGETIWVHGSNAQVFTASVGVERTDDDSGLVITAPSIGRANLPDDACPPVVFAEVRYFLPAPSGRGGFSLNAAVCLKYRVDAAARVVASGPVAIPDNATSLESRRNVRLLRLTVPLGPESGGIAVRVEVSFTLAPPEGPCSHEWSARDGYTVNVAGQDGAQSSDAGEQSAPPASEALGDRVTIISARARFTT